MVKKKAKERRNKEIGRVPEIKKKKEKRKKSNFQQIKSIQLTNANRDFF